MSFLSLYHLFSSFLTKEEVIHFSLVQDDGGIGVLSAPFTVTLDMQNANALRM